MERDDLTESLAADDIVGDEGQLDPSNPDHAFSILEQEFTQTATRVEQDPQATQYAPTFTKLFEALYLYYEKSKQLENECVSLRSNLDSMQYKLEIAEKLTETDANTIEELKNQIQQSWKMADAAHYREQVAQETIDNLRKQNSDLAAELDLKNKLTQESTEDMGQLNKYKEGLQRERDRLLGDISLLKEKVDDMKQIQENLHIKIAACTEAAEDAQKQMEAGKSENLSLKRIVEKLEGNITDLSEQLQIKEKIILDQSKTIEANQKQMFKTDALLREQKMEIDRNAKDLNASNARYRKLSEEKKYLQEECENSKKEIKNKRNELKILSDELQFLKNELTKVLKQRDILEKKLKSTEGDRDAVTQEREKLRVMVGNMEREVQAAKKGADMDKRDLDNCAREKEILNKNILRHQAMTQDHLKLIRIQEQSRQKLEIEIDDFKIENSKQKKQIVSLERERDRLAEEQLDLTSRIDNLMYEINMKKNDIYEMKKQLAELENRIRMQQNLFEAVNADRNSLQKTLLEVSAEIGELKEKLKISSHQTEQLKEDISMKEQLLVKEETILRKVTKEKENLVVDLNNAAEQIKLFKQELFELSAEEKRLHKVIMEGDRTIRQQSKDLDQLMNERDTLGSQLVRRNDELALLYEKIRILQSTLHRGEAQYDQRLEDIRLLKIEIKRLRQEKSMLSKSVNNINDLRQEVFLMERDLTRERLKCRALEEELHKPINIHRWRKLEGSDPTALELLQKIQILQKRLLKQSSEAVEREKQLKEIERLYLNLRQVVSKQPGAEIQSELIKTQRALVDKKNKMKCLVAELNMTELQIKELKMELEKTTEELNKFKKRYAAEHRVEQKKTELPTTVKTETSSAVPPVKFTGGGFRMSVDSMHQNK